VLERLFRLREHGTTPRAELRGGIVTFLAMAYVIFVQPGVLSSAWNGLWRGDGRLAAFRPQQPRC